MVITIRFVDGLIHEIKAVVLVHKTKDLNTASSLALLQEVLLGQTNKEWRKNDEFAVSKQPVRNPYSLPNTKQNNVDIEARKSLGTSKSKTQDDKLLALMAY